MTKGGLSRVCLVPRLSGVGGMVSFQHKLASGLAARGVEVCYDLADDPYQAVLVVGGTRHLAGLWRARRSGIPVIQRLDGMNWMHRVRAPGKRRADLRHFLRAEYGNFLLALIRSRLAQRIVYQSEFSRSWWERVYGPTPVASRVIYNGVDLNIFTDEGPHQRPVDRCRVLLVEGSLMGGYEQGLAAAVQFAESLDQEIRASHSLTGYEGVELMIAGRVSPELQRHWTAASKLPIRWSGLVPREAIPALDRSAHLLYSADLNAACPNSVIEALACGLPVVAFATGALPELISGDAGRVTAYGGDPWKLDPPDVHLLATAAAEILRDPERFRKAARLRAKEAFGLDRMVEEYLECLT